MILPHEIEHYDSATGELWVWVKVPTLSASTDTTITMQYGNPYSSNMQDIASVWDGNYAGVWHMQETSGDVPEPGRSSRTTMLNVDPLCSAAT